MIWVRHTKIYISGPITGTSDYMERFARAEQFLYERGYSVINPAKVNDQLPIETSYNEYIKMSLTMLDMADAIYMLYGWENSLGSKAEKMVAEANGLQVIYENKNESKSFLRD